MGYKEKSRTKTLMFPDVGLHAHPIEGMLSQKSQPCLDSLRIAIFDLDEPTECYPLKIFLALLVYEVASRECPALHNAW